MFRWTVGLLFGLLSGGLIGVFVAGTHLQGQAPVAPPGAVLPRELTSFRDVVKKVLPGVVSIEARARSRAIQRRGLPDMQLPEDFRKFLERQQEAEEPSPAGFGSGFIVDPRGLVLTNFHVVDGADQVEVQLRDGRKFLSKDIKSDAKTDLALIRIETKEALPFLQLGDSDQMEIGDRVLAVGAPFGLTGSVTAGIISAKGRSLKVNMYEDFLQTDAAINPGNSGGPLVNMEGKVIGVNSAIKSRSGGFQGVGLAIASNLVRVVMDQLLKDGVVHRGYLGVQIKDLDNAAVAARLGAKEGQGVLITQVFPKAPASKAGLQDGDVILSLDGKAIKDGRELQLVVATLPLGKPVTVSLLRDGKPLTLQVTVEEQPQTFGTARVPVPRMPREQIDTVKLDKAGLEVADLTPELAAGLGYREGLRGAVVVNTERLSLAAQAGLVRGMVISKVDRQTVDSARALKEVLSGAKLDAGVLLQVHTPQGGTNFVLLKSGAE